MAPRKRASRTRINPGESSLERVADALPPRGPYDTYISVRTWDGRLKRIKIRASTKGEFRRKGREKVEEALSSSSSRWKKSDPVADFIDAVSARAVDAAPLRPNTKNRYVLALAQVRVQLDGLTIADATRFRALERALKTVADVHGAESARQARTVMSKYLLDQLIREDLIDHNPLRGISIDLGTVNKATSSVTDGRRALTDAQYNAVIDHLIARDVTVPLPPGTDRRRTSIVRHDNIVAMTLLQAGTGLRLGEALALTSDDMIVTDGSVSVTVTAAVSKTHRARTVPVLDDRVADYWRDRLTGIPAGAPLIPAPGNPHTVWRRDNATHAAASLYKALGSELSDDVIGRMRSHSWRTVLNARAISRGVGADVRSAFFGHDATMNARAYTDLTDIESMVNALKLES